MEQEIGRKNLYITFIVLIFLGQVVFGFYYYVFGANAPVMMDYYQITPTQQGFIITMKAMGALIVSLYLAMYGERHNKINLICISMLVLSASSITIGFAPPYMALIFAAAIGGAAYNTINVMANSIIPEMYFKQKETLIPILHAFFGVGAMVIPIVVTLMVNPNAPASFVRPFFLIGALEFILLIIFFVVGRRILPLSPYADMESVKKHNSGNPTEIFKTKKAWLFLFATLLYFSFQIGIASWLPTYCLELGMDFGTAGAMLTAFFLGSLVMRFCGPLILRKINAQKAYFYFGMLSAITMVAALFLTNVIAMMILVTIAGFMQGSCVAFLILMATEAFPHRVASASSIIYIGVNGAVMTAPLWMGAIAEHIGFRVPLLLICLFMVFSAILIMGIRKDEREV